MSGRFPFAPLIPLIEHQWRPLDERSLSGATLQAKAARVLDIDGSIAWRWIKNGLTERAADRCAVRLGVHPCQIWDDWFELPSMEWIDGELWRPIDWLRKCALEESWRLRRQCRMVAA